MKSVLMAVVGMVLWGLASAATADMQSWNYKSSYSTTDNSLGAGKFASGYLYDAPGYFGTYNRYANDGGYNGINRWDDSGTAGQNTDTRGNAGINTNATATEMNNWGTGGMYFEAGQTTLMPGTSGVWAAIRWTAPATGQYVISALFTDQCLDAGAGKTTGVRVREGAPDGVAYWTSTLSGFVGRAVNNYTDATGTNQSATYSGTLNLTAGQAIDFIVEAGSTKWLMTGVDITIATAPIPEPASLALLALGSLALLRRRR